jgi:[NiFe] hydrogenase large subunit
MDFAATRNRLQQYVDSGQLGPFAGGYWGHPAMQLAPEENLLLVTHYLYALREQVKAARMHAIFGAKNPHLQSLRVGGVTCQRDISEERVAEFRGLLGELRHFIDTVYLPDVKYLAQRYAGSGWGSYGGSRSYLAYGEFQLGNDEPADLYFPRGAIFNQEVSDVVDVDTAQISEHVAHSWYVGTASHHPSAGETDPAYTTYDTEDRYSWLKAPRYQGEPMEVGPLARVLVAYGRGHEQVVPLVNALLADTGLPVSALHSILGRTAARAIETKVIADAMDGWLDQLAYGEAALVNATIPAAAMGCGLNEAPRGALGHWIDIADGKIGNYQMVVPSTWNFGPRCSANRRGPVEEALIGIPVVNPAQPVEVLRAVHSFDPCIACAVHVIDVHQGATHVVEAA